tara:strand:- start:730 stop:933 length:204 start_codon:yes stop_codon:yes gene_type:complete
MMKLSLILNFIGSLVPVIFPDKEFKPKRLIAVVVLFVMSILAGEYFGFASVEMALNLTEQAIELTEE